MFFCQNFVYFSGTKSAAATHPRIVDIIINNVKYFHKALALKFTNEIAEQVNIYFSSNAMRV